MNLLLLREICFKTRSLGFSSTTVLLSPSCSLNSSTIYFPRLPNPPGFTSAAFRPSIALLDSTGSLFSSRELDARGNRLLRTPQTLLISRGRAATTTARSRNPSKAKARRRTGPRGALWWAARRTTRRTASPKSFRTPSRRSGPTWHFPTFPRVRWLCPLRFVVAHSSPFRSLYNRNVLLKNTAFTNATATLNFTKPKIG